jgi:hypothetical protein
LLRTVGNRGVFREPEGAGYCGVSSSNVTFFGVLVIGFIPVSARNT